MPALIASIEKGSIAEELEIKPNSILLSVNGQKLKDYIEYQSAVLTEEITFEIKTPNGELEEYEIEKDFEEDLGLIFESAIFDKIKPCANNCIFCFVDQQPKGLRDSLYIKDDDYRLSYLQGTYVTLTNLTKKDKERIATMHLGPLFISVHTTNPELRCKMLNNRFAGEALEKVKKSFAQMARFTSRCIRLAGKTVRAKGSENADKIGLELDEYMLRLLNAFLSGGDYLPHRQIFQKTALLSGLVSQNVKLGNVEKAKEHLNELLKTRDDFFEFQKATSDRHCLMFLEGDTDGSHNTTKEKINQRVEAAQRALQQA